MTTVTVILSVLAVGASAACGGDTADEGGEGEEPSEYVFGSIIPLSGPIAPLGEALERSQQLFFEEHPTIGGVPVRVVVCDDGAAPEQAAACARKLIEQDRADIILGPHLAGAYQGAAPVLADGPPNLVLSPYVTAEGGTSAFQVSGASQALTDESLEFAATLGRRIGVLATTDTTGQVGVDQQEELARELGLELKVERMDLLDPSATTQLAALKDFNPDGVILWMSGRATGVAFQGLKELRMDSIPVIMVNSNLSTGFLRAVAPILPAELYTAVPEAALTDPNLIQDPEVKEAVVELREQYEEKFGAPPDFINIVAADGFELAADVLERSKGDEQAAVEYLETLEEHQLVAFTVDYSETDHIGAEGDGVYEVFQVGPGGDLSRP